MIAILLLAACFLKPAAGFATTSDSIEGIYEVNLKCDGDKADCDLGLMESIDRVTIVNVAKATAYSGHKISEGVSVSFSSSRDGYVLSTVYAAKVDEEDPGHLSGEPVDGIGNPVVAFFDLKVDPKTGTISGEVDDFQSAITCHLTGRALRRAVRAPNSNYSTQVDSDQIMGVSRLKLGDVPGKIRLKKRLDNVLVGSFTSDARSDGQADETFDFFAVTWDAPNGKLRLQFVNRWQAIGEFILYYDESSGGRNAFKGFEFSGFNFLDSHSEL